jgi:hypothetical protein
MSLKRQGFFPKYTILHIEDYTLHIDVSEYLKSDGPISFTTPDADFFWGKEKISDILK